MGKIGKGVHKDTPVVILTALQGGYISLTLEIYNDETIE